MLCDALRHRDTFEYRVIHATLHVRPCCVAGCRRKVSELTCDFLAVLWEYQVISLGEIVAGGFVEGYRGGWRP